MYFYGEGVRQDFRQSAYWYRRAAADHSIIGEVNLAIAYERGYGVTEDSTEARRLYENAVLHGSPVARCRLIFPLETTADQVRHNFDLLSTAGPKSGSRISNPRLVLSTFRK